MKPWLAVVLLSAAVSLTLGALTSGGPQGWWMLAGALFAGIMWAVIVWRSGHTPASAWHNLRKPPRDDL